MLVRFSEISPLGSQYEIRNIDGFDERSELVLCEPLQAQCTLVRKSDSKVELQGRVETSLTLTCDRCLSPYCQKVDAELHMLLEVESADTWQVKDLEYNIPDLDTVLVDEPVVDLDDVIRQHIYLALPVKNLCSEQCRGMCPRCGANRNATLCGCSDEKRESPFAVLAQFKK
jgi:uncharacterized protein